MGALCFSLFAASPPLLLLQCLHTYRKRGQAFRLLRWQASGRGDECIVVARLDWLGAVVQGLFVGFAGYLLVRGQPFSL